MFNLGHDPINTKCRLYALAKEKLNRKNDLISDLAVKYVPDVIFIQMDPMLYITRQRLVTQRITQENKLNTDIIIQNNPYPISWEEAMVNPKILDMSYSVHLKSESSNSTKYDNSNLHIGINNKVIEWVSDCVIDGKWSPYKEINNLLYLAVSMNFKVILGDMPELLLRQILGNTISIWEARDIFKSVLKQIKLSEGNLDMPTATMLLYSHLFQSPKDIYMSTMLREISEECYSILAFVGQPHFIPIQKYWLPPPSGVSLKTVTTIPKQILSETTDDLIEKQAIFEILFGTKIWNDKYITNQFPYIEKDATKISKEDLEAYKKTYYINYKKYEAFRDKIVEGSKIKKTDSTKFKANM
jgi:hypothetical protein